jgi:hypothetical protein
VAGRMIKELVLTHRCVHADAESSRVHAVDAAPVNEEGSGNRFPPICFRAWCACSCPARFFGFECRKSYFTVSLLTTNYLTDGTCDHGFESRWVFSIHTYVHRVGMYICRYVHMYVKCVEMLKSIE